MISGPIVTFSEPLNDVAGLRELPDGRILVIERGERRVVALQEGKPLQQVGRQGDGPGEYRYPHSIIGIGGDSSIVSDAQSRRWLVLRGSRVITTLHAEHPLVAALQANLAGADQAGRIAGLVPFTSRAVQARYAGFADSARVVVGRLPGTRVDTVARLVMGSAAVRIAQRGGTTYFLTNPMAVDEHAVLLRDGTLAVVRPAPFAVELIGQDGSKVLAPKVESPPRIVGEAEQRAAIARRWFVPGYTGPRWEPTDFDGWPKTVPHFMQNGVFATREGAVVLRRAQRREEDAATYDVFTRVPAIHYTITLRPRQRIVGFGRGAVYLATQDEDDMDVVSRHPWTIP